MTKLANGNRLKVKGLAYLHAIANLEAGREYRSYSKEDGWLKPELTASGAVPTRFIGFYTGNTRRAVAKTLCRLEEKGLVEREVCVSVRMGWAWKLTGAGKRARNSALQLFTDGYAHPGIDEFGMNRSGFDRFGINFTGHDVDGNYKGFSHLKDVYNG